MATYSLTPASTTVTENDTSLTFTVTRTGSNLTSESLYVSTLFDTASSPGDYDGIDSQLLVSFVGSSLTATFTVGINEDSLVESTEHFRVMIARNASDGSALALDISDINITDDDVATPTTYSLTPASTTVTENDTSLTFTVTRTGSNLTSESLYVSTLFDTASSPGDYDGIDSQLLVSFVGSSLTATFTVGINEDSLVESTEHFRVMIARNASDGSALALDISDINITDDDVATPTTYSLTPASTTVTENDTSLTFTVTRTGSNLTSESLYVSTLFDTASSPGDYDGIDSQLLVSFVGSSLTATFTVGINEDSLVESTEHFRVMIARNASDGSALALDISDINITDDDVATPTTYSLTPASTTVTENDTSLTFTVTRTGSNLTSESLYVSTLFDTASSPGDYDGIDSQLLVSFVGSSLTATFTVGINEDSLVESTEHFRVMIARNASDGSALALDISDINITDDDVATPTTYSLTPASTTVTENDTSLTFTVTRTGSNLTSESLYVSTLFDTASSPGDYDGIDSQLLVSFVGSSLTATFTVGINEDSLVESTEHFRVMIARNASDGSALALDISDINITDDDVATPTTYSLTPASTTVTENDTSLTFTVTRTGSNLTSESLYVSTLFDTASSPGDYDGIDSQLLVSFVGSSLTATFTVGINEDSLVESTEHFRVMIARNASDGSALALDISDINITDDDVATPTTYSLTPASTTVTENDTSLTFTVTRTGSNLQPETIFASTIHTPTYGYATNQSDYTPLSNVPIVFTGIETTATVTVEILDDGNIEANETFGLIVQRSSADLPNVFLDSSTFTILANSEATTDDYRSDAATSGTIDAGSTATGVIEAAYDTDWFKAELIAGHTYRFDLEGSATSQGSLLDPYMSVRTPGSGSIKLAENDDGGVGLNAQFTYTPTTTDSYFLAAGSSTTGTGSYTMRLTDVTVATTDDYLAAPGTTGSVIVGGTATGAIEAPNDTDWFKVELVAGRTYQFDLEGSPTGLGTLADPYLSIRIPGTGDTKLAEDDDAGAGYNARFTYTPTTTETYFVGAGSANGGIGTYTVGVTDVTSVPPPYPDNSEVFAEGKFTFLAKLAQAAYAFDLPGELRSTSIQGAPGGLFVDNVDGTAIALVGRSSDSLFVAFRGTDDAIDVINWAHMETHYARFEPLIEQIDSYLAANPDIKHVYVTGHSLGGSMAQYFTATDAYWPRVSVETVTFASAGMFLGADLGDDRITNFYVDGDIIQIPAGPSSVWGDRYVFEDVSPDTLGSVTKHSMSLYLEIARYADSINAVPYAGIAHDGDADPWLIPVRISSSAGTFQVEAPTVYQLSEVPASVYVALTGGNTFVGGIERQVVSFAVDKLTSIDVDLIKGVASSASWAVSNTLTDIQNVFTGDGDDVISGNGFTNWFLGGAGNDRVFGLGGLDFLIGGSGEGDDLYDGGDDADTVIYTSTSHGIVVDLSLAQNQATGSEIGTDQLISIENVVGGSGDDRIIGGAGINRLEGGGGNDKLYSYAVDYTSSASTNDGANILDGGDGNDELRGSGGAEQLLGGRGDDVLAGRGGADVLDGGEGFDIALITRTLLSTPYVFDFSPGAGGNIVEPDGARLISIEAIQFTGGAGAETVTGGANMDVLIGGGGNDTLSGKGEGDDIRGDAGNDTLAGGTGFDLLEGGEGDDLFVFAPGDQGDSITDFVAAGTEDRIDLTRFTSITSFAGVLAIATEVGTRVELRFQSGDVLSLYDTTKAELTAADFILAPPPGVTIIGTSGNDTIDGTRTVRGQALPTAGNDTINGNNGNDTISGLAGNDTLNGGSGTDRLLGGAGNDTLNGGSGTDTLLGGAGDDVYFVDVAADVIQELTGEGSDTVHFTSTTANATYALSTNSTTGFIENLTLDGKANIRGAGNNRDNVLTGNSGNNTLTGNGGNDTLNGGAGTDSLVGGAGNDTYIITAAGTKTITEASNAGTDTVLSAFTHTLATNVENLTLTGSSNVNGTGNASNNIIAGNSGNNTLNGGTGADTLIGGLGLDMLTGGSGADRFAFNLPTDGLDRVTDFVSGTDKLQISASGFGNGLVAGQAVALLVVADIGLASIAGNDGYFILDNAGPLGGNVYWDPTGGDSSDATAFVTLNALSITATDFSVV